MLQSTTSLNESGYSSTDPPEIRVVFHSLRPLIILFCLFFVITGGFAVLLFFSQPSISLAARVLDGSSHAGEYSYIYPIQSTWAKHIRVTVTDTKTTIDTVLHVSRFPWYRTSSNSISFEFTTPDQELNFTAIGLFNQSPTVTKRPLQPTIEQFKITTSPIVGPTAEVMISWHVLNAERITIENYSTTNIPSDSVTVRLMPMQSTLKLIAFDRFSNAAADSIIDIERLYKVPNIITFTRTDAIKKLLASGFKHHSFESPNNVVENLTVTDVYPDVGSLRSPSDGVIVFLSQTDSISGDTRQPPRDKALLAISFQRNSGISYLVYSTLSEQVLYEGDSDTNRSLRIPKNNPIRVDLKPSSFSAMVSFSCNIPETMLIQIKCNSNSCNVDAGGTAREEEYCLEL